MKKFISCVYLMGTLIVSGQTLSNPGFESWGTSTTYTSDTVPNQWWTMYCNTVHQTTDAYQGTFATRLQGNFSCGIAPGIMANGERPVNYLNIIDSGTPFTAKPGSLSGFYRYTGVTDGDSAEVTVILKHYNSALMTHDTVALGTLSLPPAAGYTSFNVPISDLMPGVSPDSIIIMFNSSKHMLFDLTTMELPSLYIDRIGLPQGNAGIPENSSVMESVLYPNPFSSGTTLEIKGDLNVYQHISLTLFDAGGRAVKTIDDITGNTVFIGNDGLSSGTYFYTVTSASGILSKGKMVVR